jgi:hypothetical protein
MPRGILTIVAIFGLVGLAAADEKKADKPKAEPEGTPLELSITGKATKYTLDTGGLSHADYKKKIEDATKKKSIGRPPAPPTVDLTVEIKNTSDKPVKVWTKGDPVVLTLELKGKGAVNADVLGPMTLEFRIPQALEIEPGKTASIAVKSLRSGMRGLTHYSFWTEPGEYELVAKLKTGVNPAPKGAKEGMDGFGVVTLTSAPLKLTVEEKK